MATKQGRSALNATIRESGPMASPPDDPEKRKRGRPPKVEKERIAARTHGGHARKIPQVEIDEIQAMAAASRIEDVVECPVCALSKAKRERCEEDLLVVTSGNTTADGMNAIGQVANKYSVKLADLVRHRDKCMVKESLLALEKPRSFAPAAPASANDIGNSAAWIAQLTKYQRVIDGVIEVENEKDIPDSRLLLNAAESGRRLCETNAKLFLDIYKLRVDKRVQDDFIRIVLETVEKVAPAAKDEIIRKLKARLAMASAAGVGGA